MILLIVDGGLTEWTQYTPCSKSCGNGVQIRYRYCANPYAQNGGKPCNGDLEDTKACKVKECKCDKASKFTFTERKNYRTMNN